MLNLAPASDSSPLSPRSPCSAMTSATLWHSLASASGGSQYGIKINENTPNPCSFDSPLVFIYKGKKNQEIHFVHIFKL